VGRFRFNVSDTWQLVINTSTRIVTFLLGLLILLEANRSAKESKVVHDELIRSVAGARNQFINVDEMSEVEIDNLEAGLRLRAARSNRGTPEGARVTAPGNDADRTSWHRTGPGSTEIGRRPLDQSTVLRDDFVCQGRFGR
jgi:low affinity Fe/Cu permease